MSGMGMALMGTGIAEGEHRAVEAAQRAISSPLLEDASIHGARGVLINVTGGEDMTLHEVAEAANIIQEAAEPDANIIFGTVVDRALQGKVKVTVIATGFVRDQIRPAVGAPGPSKAAPGAEIGSSEPIPTVVRPSSGFLRRGQSEPLDFDATDEGFTPNFAKLKDDLDVPAFLRKQMD
jgi:cell division protein FtsZ